MKIKRVEEIFLEPSGLRLSASMEKKTLSSAWPANEDQRPQQLNCHCRRGSFVRGHVSAPQQCLSVPTYLRCDTLSPEDKSSHVNFLKPTKKQQLRDDDYQLVIFSSS